MKQQRSEQAILFIKQKKDTLIAAGIAAVIVVVAVLSFGYLREQKQNEAREAFGKALSSQGQEAALEEFRAITQDFKGSIYATYANMFLGLNLLDKQEHREAAIAFEEALRSKQPAAFLTAQLWELRAVALEFDGSLDEALSSFQRALSIQNNSYRRNEVLLKAGLLNLRMGQNEEAKRMFEEIIADGTANERTLRIARNEIAALEM